MPKRSLVATVAVVVVALGTAVFVTVAPTASAGQNPHASSLQGWAGKCIDVPHGIAAGGVQLQLWDCNGMDAQLWTATPQGREMALDKCMEVAGGSRDNGAKIQLANCTGNPAQQWVLSGAGDLVNPQANKCVDVRDWNSANGAPLVLWDCNGGANQKWRLVGMGRETWVRYWANQIPLFDVSRETEALWRPSMLDGFSLGYRAALLVSRRSSTVDTLPVPRGPAVTAAHMTDLAIVHVDDDAVGGSQDRPTASTSPAR